MNTIIKEAKDKMDKLSKERPIPRKMASGDPMALNNTTMPKVPAIVMYNWEPMFDIVHNVESEILYETMNKALKEDSRHPTRAWCELPETETPEFATTPFEDEASLAYGPEDDRLGRAFGMASSVASDQQQKILHYRCHNPGATHGEGPSGNSQLASIA